MGVNVMEIFEKEVANLTQKITTTALELEKAPADRSLLEDLMRSFHTLKGSARAIQFDAILEVAHAMEGLYHQLLDHDGTARPDLIELSLFATDIVKMLMGSDEKEAPHIFAQSIIKYQSGQPLDLPRKRTTATDGSGDISSQSPTLPVPIEDEFDITATRSADHKM